MSFTLADLLAVIRLVICTPPQPKHHVYWRPDPNGRGETERVADTLKRVLTPVSPRESRTLAVMSRSSGSHIRPVLWFCQRYGSEISEVLLLKGWCQSNANSSLDDAPRSLRMAA
jgi:hypothetical protein